MYQETRNYLDNRLRESRPLLNSLINDGFRLGDDEYLRRVIELSDLFLRCRYELDRDITQTSLDIG